MAKVNSITGPMLSLAKRYVAHRHMLGYTMSDAGRLLAFAGFMDRVAPGRPLSSALALQWVTEVSTRQRNTQAGLLSTIRGFARYCTILDPRTQIPGARLLPSGYTRRRPHIFSRQQIRLVLKRARTLTTHYGPLHPLTYVTFFGLLACTGIRSGEARRLMLDDFDPNAGILRIGRFKSSPPRTIPLHTTTVRALQDYVRIRRRCFPFSESLFVGVTGKPLKAVPVRKVFHRMCAGIVCNGEARRPELSDFRHTFVSHWIAEWSRQAEPVSHHLLLLARYLGHVNFSSTWWYVTSDPRSLCEAAAAFRRYHQQRTPPRP